MRKYSTKDEVGLRAKLLGALTGICVFALPAQGTASEGAILVSTWQATSFEAFGPDLRKRLSERFEHDLIQTNGDIDVLRLVRADPRSVGFVQRDFFVDRLRRDPQHFDRLEFYGDVPACLVVVVRKGSPIQTYADLVASRSSRRVTLDIGPATGRVAATFALLRALDPALDNVDREMRGGSRALSRVASGETTAALLIDYAPFRNADLDSLLDRDAVDLVPLISRPIAAAALKENIPYALREITLSKDGWLDGGRTYHTTCTSLGVVVNEKADARLSEAVAHAMLQSRLSSEPDFSFAGSLTMLGTTLGEIWRFLVGLTQFVGARLFGDAEWARGVPASSGAANAPGNDPGNATARRPTISNTLERATGGS